MSFSYSSEACQHNVIVIVQRKKWDKAPQGRSWRVRIEDGKKKFTQVYGIVVQRYCIQSTSEIRTFGFRTTLKSEQMLVRFNVVRISDIRAHDQLFGLKSD